MTGNVVWKAILIILIGFVVRFIVTFFCAFARAGKFKLTLKEKIFVGFGWSPKGSVQAALGYTILNDVIKKNLN